MAAPLGGNHPMDFRVPSYSQQRATARQETARVLRERIRALERHGPIAEQERVSSGWPALDRLLPEQGFRRGTLVEWLTLGEGCGGEFLALGAAARAVRGERDALVIVDGQGWFYPPALRGWGVDLRCLVVVRPRNLLESLWTLEQVLRCAGVAAVVGCVEQLQGRAFRRLQLAAERGGSLGMLCRKTTARQEPSWADTRLHVQPCPSERGWVWRVELLHTREGTAGKAARLEIDDEFAYGSTSFQRVGHAPHPLRLVPPLAPAAVRRRASRA